MPLNYTGNLHFCAFLVTICPLFTIFVILVTYCTYALHLYPPKYAQPIYLILSFSQNFNRNSNSFTRSPLHLYFRSDARDTGMNNLGWDLPWQIMACVIWWSYGSFKNMIITMMIQQHDDNTIIMLVIFMETIYCS